MSSLNSQPSVDNSQNSIWTIILSSSVALAVITGLLYWVGGAAHIGRSRALGLDYLAGRQPAEYIFFGAQVLGAGFLILTVFVIPVVLVISLSFNFSSNLMRRALSRRWEWIVFWVFVVVLIAAALFCVNEVKTSRGLSTKGACPITSSDSMPVIVLLIFGMIATLSPLISRFLSRVSCV